MWNWAELGPLIRTKRLAMPLLNFKLSAAPKPDKATLVGLKTTLETKHAIDASMNTAIESAMDAVVDAAVDKNRNIVSGIFYTRAEDDVDPVRVIDNLSDCPELPGITNTPNTVFMWAAMLADDERPLQVAAGFRVYVEVCARPLRDGVCFIGNSETDIRCGETGGDIRETTVYLYTSENQRIKFSAVVFKVYDQRYVTLLPLVGEDACFFRATVLRMSAYVATLGSLCPFPAPKMAFMDVYAYMSKKYFQNSWGGPCCGSAILDQAWDIYKGEKSRSRASGGGGGAAGASATWSDERIPLDWTSPMNLLRAASCRPEVRGHLEIQALVAATVFTFGLPATFSALIDLVREYTHLKYTRPVTGNWVVGFHVQGTLLAVLFQLAVTGDIGALANRLPIMDAIENHTCDAEKRLQMIFEGDDSHVKHEKTRDEVEDHAAKCPRVDVEDPHDEEPEYDNV